MLTDSRTAMKRQKGNVNKHGFWEKKKERKKKTMILNVRTDFKIT